MATHWQFLNRLRQDLGKGYTTAEEHSPDPALAHVLVLHRRDDVVLTVLVDARWLALRPHADTTPARVEYKHLAAAIRNFFERPERLPAHTFDWPGTRESRDELRRTLGHRDRVGLFTAS